MGEYLKYVVIFLVVLVIIGLIYSARMDDYDENFIVRSYPYPKYCTNCGGLSRSNCGKCMDCGYIYTADNRGECVPGDSNGPYFRDDYVAYRYQDADYSIDSVYPYSYIGDYPYWYRDGYYGYYDGYYGGYPRSTYGRRYYGRSHNHTRPHTGGSRGGHTGGHMGGHMGGHISSGGRSSGGHSSGGRSGGGRSGGGHSGGGHGGRR